MQNERRMYWFLLQILGGKKESPAPVVLGLSKSHR